MESGNIVGDEKKDRISELPINVIDCIFEGMPVRDAARTVILSRYWSSVWPSYPQLVFDKNFAKEIHQKHGRFFQVEFTKAINNVLSIHNGPVLKFFLHIPKFRNDISSEIDQWMLHLSSNGIKELELENRYSTPYIVPTCMLLCSSLIVLKLYNCIVKRPRAFRGFNYLVRLFLMKVSISGGTSKTLLRNALVLRKLVIWDCIGINQRNIYAPKLKNVSMVNNDKVDWQWFKRSKNLKYMHLCLCKDLKIVNRRISMIKFLKNIRKVKRLKLNGATLKYLAAGSPSKSLAAPVRSLKLVSLTGFRAHDLDQISCAFCLLKNSPKLTTLELHVKKSADDVPKHITEYLESSNCNDLRLDMLRKVKIIWFKGTKAELLSIKFLLARSSNLRKMVIERHASLDPSHGDKAYQELLQYTRASSRAEIRMVPRERRAHLSCCHAMVW